MLKKMISFAVALTAFAAFAAPAQATLLLYPNGEPVAKGTQVEATNNGMTAESNWYGKEIRCQNWTIKGKVTKNTGTIGGQITPYASPNGMVISGCTIYRFETSAPVVIENGTAGPFTLFGTGETGTGEFLGSYVASYAGFIGLFEGPLKIWYQSGSSEFWLGGTTVSGLGIYHSWYFGHFQLQTSTGVPLTIQN